MTEHMSHSGRSMVRIAHSFFTGFWLCLAFNLMTAVIIEFVMGLTKLDDSRRKRALLDDANLVGSKFEALACELHRKHREFHGFGHAPSSDTLELCDTFTRESFSAAMCDYQVQS